MDLGLGYGRLTLAGAHAREVELDGILEREDLAPRCCPGEARADDGGEEGGFAGAHDARDADETGGGVEGAAQTVTDAFHAAECGDGAGQGAHDNVDALARAGRVDAEALPDAPAFRHAGLVGVVRAPAGAHVSRARGLHGRLVDDALRLRRREPRVRHPAPYAVLLHPHGISGTENNVRGAFFHTPEQDAVHLGAGELVAQGLGEEFCHSSLPSVPADQFSISRNSAGTLMRNVVSPTSRVRFSTRTARRPSASTGRLTMPLRASILKRRMPR